MKRPRSSRFRNLYIDRGRIWYERVTGGRRFRVDTGIEPVGQDAWDEAALFRDGYEREKGIGSARRYGDMPTFTVMAERYLLRRTDHLSTREKLSRKARLKRDGPVLARLGAMYVDEITGATLLLWWEDEIQGRNRSL